MPLIDLSDAVNVVEGYRDRNPDSWSLCNSIKFDIAELPTISPDEVRGVGEWIITTDRFAPDLTCSNCNATFPAISGCCLDAKINYCPSCGARMTRAEAEKAMEVSEDA